MIKQTLEKLKPRLESPIPLLVFEAAEAVRPLARRFPETIGPLALEWSGSVSFSLRLSAHLLLLECGGPWAEPSRVRGMLREVAQLSEEEWKQQSWDGTNLSGQRARGWLRLPHEFVDKSLVLLVEEQSNPEHDELIMRVGMQERGTLSASLGLFHRLDRERFKALFEWQDLMMAEALVGLVSSKPEIEPPPSRDWDILDFILRITPESPSGAVASANSNQAFALGRFICGLGFSDEMSLGDTVTFLTRIGDSEQKDLIGRAAVVALGIYPLLLRQEALALLDCARGPVSWLSLMEVMAVMLKLPRLPVTPDWKKAAKLELSGSDLVLALSHPSWAVSHIAAQLLECGAGGQDVPEMLEQRSRALREYEDEHLVRHVLTLAPVLWGARRSAAVLLPLLAPPVSLLNSRLYEALPWLYRQERSEVIVECLLRGIESPDSGVAHRAAEALLEIAELLPTNALDVLSRSTEGWAWREPRCERHPQAAVEGRVCSACRTVLSHPKVPLLKLLLRKGYLGVEQGLRLIQSPDQEVQRIAAAALVSQPTAERLAELIRKGAEQQLPACVMEQVLALEAIHLREVQSELMALLRSHWAALRERMIEALATAEWVRRDEALRCARSALQDPVPSVRNQAVMTIRYLVAQEIVTGA
ncbi:hypothetical protein [Myxococcus sp. RHSTA-1-4]|uniref:hypothetical protein n=1 Tax=Myxococcus sp. RHSTA-1-4 TaxID=2874601 RepID=UPI001CC1BC90|nr:hypothetical protein [Myxococcus sp. RHSTA-1-4]MBZ4422331.1 hypothetical protein [Myxococcus sp. RHSTA-1-4]